MKIGGKVWVDGSVGKEDKYDGKKKISIIYRKKRLVSPAQISNFVRLSLAPHASHHFQSVYVKA